MTRFRSVALGLVAALFCFQNSALAENASSGGEISLQLNKAVSQGQSCRVSLVMQNGLSQTIEQLGVDLVIFDRSGGVFDFLTVKAGRLPAGKTRVRQYDLSGQDCTNISSLLVNDVRSCDGDGLNQNICLDALTTSSLANIDLTL
ncbi:hypothetical protein [Flexibacterium corallicola]|uniref:hypothetical protein n=1 Tax=Flexibacterium corallicola TaxID=3037259 RepID=UPI00286F657E|nr:hypothetical protein [Pseudovibrio sp. M1P-2-3]